MRFLSFGDISVGGQLSERLALSHKRMQEPMYAVPSVFHDKAGDQSFDWPGDWEGRTLLALILLGRASNRTPETLEPILKELPAYINKSGYMGPEIKEGYISEQLLSGNSWLMRALCELYEWRHEDAVLKQIEAMVEGLMLKTSGTFGAYPIAKGERQIGGGREAGNLTGEVSGGWLSSTDIGCAFIMTDGASHAYHITKDARLYKLLTEMIERFSQADLTGATFQTHATLSALRGILRFYGDTGEKWLLSLGKRVFDYYVKNGMTENYANHNWFGRPEWTEPCAIIDSYIAAVELWKYTRKPEYLEYAHRILYNAIYYAQRHNGGFGCDVCVGAHSPLLHPTGEDSYEAWWCCTMRGGEGLARAAQYLAAFDGDTVYLPMYENAVFGDGSIRLREETGYPAEGRVRLTVEKSDGSYKRFAIFVPSWARGACASVDGRSAGHVKNGFLIVEDTLSAGTVVELTFELSLEAAEAMSPAFAGRHTIRYGALMLCARTQDGALSAMPQLSGFNKHIGKELYFENEKGERLYTLGDMTFKGRDEILNTKLQVIF